MASQAPVRDYLLPRDTVLINEAVARARSSEVDPTSDVNRPLEQRVLERDRFNLNLSRSSGAAPDVVMAVLIDIITPSRFDTAAPDLSSDSKLHRDWHQTKDGVVLVNGTTPVNVPTIGGHAEDDFITPLTFRD